MAALTEYNATTGYAEFAIEDDTELDLLPTTTATGQGALERVGSVTEGSLAFTADFTPYRLGANGWVQI